jgi:hypothetical protein
LILSGGAGQRPGDEPPDARIEDLAGFFISVLHGMTVLRGR